MSTVLCIARHAVDLSNGQTIEPGHIVTGVDVTGDMFNKALVDHHLLYVVTTPYTLQGGVAVPWAPNRRLQYLGDTHDTFVSANPVLTSEQVGFELDTGAQKLGDDVTHWNGLPYLVTTWGGAGATNLLDGGTP